MAAEPGKRSPRKSLSDPETVAKVSRVTAKSVHAVVTATVAVARFTARNSVAFVRWTGPRARRYGSAFGRLAWRALSATGRFAWTHKRGLAQIGHRLLWWAALAILVLFGRALLSADGDPELVGAALLWFAIGWSMSVLVLMGASEKRLRVAALALASGHGSLAALAWIASSAV
jgi:hypothetical protein